MFLKWKSFYILAVLFKFKQMIRKQLLNKVAIIILGATFFACNEEAPQVDDVVAEDVDTEQMEIEIDNFESPDEDYHLPSALQVASIFRKSGLEYNAGVTNAVENVANYTSDVKRKLNFGVYSADLAYCITNEQSNDARKFVAAIQTLAEQQGMESVFENKDLMERFDKNLDVQDSVESIIVEIHERSQEYMEENDMSHAAAVHYAGAWSEGMYIGFYDYENNGNKEGVGYKLTEQIEILGNIIKGLKDPKNAESDLAWIISDLEKVQSTFDEFETVKAYNASEDAGEMVLTDAEIKEIGALINDIRLKIVEK